MHIVNNAMAGALGGLAGGLVMTAAMMAGQQAGMIETPVPLKIERQLERRAGVAQRTSPSQEKALSMAEHMIISAVFGAGYGVLQSVLDQPAIPAGPLYGLGVYALNMGTLGPALDLMPGPWNEEPMTVGRRMLMHAVYGAVTAIVFERVRQELT